MGNTIIDTMKKTWLKGIEVIGNAASNIADNAKYKVNEMNLEAKRREILADFGSIAYDMWQKGETFPPALDAQLQQLNALEEQLTAIRAQRYAAAKEANIAGEAAAAAARKVDNLEQTEAQPEASYSMAEGHDEDADQPQKESAPEGEPEKTQD